jgi:cobalt-zinc-cadmium efflux system membrane fusion protein
MKTKSQLVAIVAIAAVTIAMGTMLLRSKPAVAAKETEAPKQEAHDDHAEKGRIKLSPTKARAAGIIVEEAGPALVKSTLKLYGRIAPNEEAMVQVTARFPGVVKSVRKRLGDPVAKGEILAVVESNTSLRTYDIVSEIAGSITRREVTPGEFVSEQKILFTVADLSSVWIDFPVYREDAARLKRGQRMLIAEGSVPVALTEATLDYLSPIGNEVTQTRLARVVLENRVGAFASGLFVNGLAILDETEVEVAVTASALQTIEQRSVVFVEENGGFEARVVEIGRRDPIWVEIRNGILPGERYATTNSFLLKAEMGKESAEHDH